MAPNTQARQLAQKFSLIVNYLLYLPEGYLPDTTQSWPLLIFLHGADERGTNLDKVKKHGPPKIVGQQPLPLVVLSPLCPPKKFWDTSLLNELLDDVLLKHAIDEDRVYLTGLSMGGFGSWQWASENPERFAAVAPVCGGGDTEKAWRIRYLPVWAFHGAKDEVVPLAYSEEMVEELEAIGADVRFTIYPDAGHDSWTASYDNPKLYEWMLTQRRKQDIDYQPDRNHLKNYTGNYRFPAGDSIRVSIRQGKLWASVQGLDYELHPETQHHFYIGHWGSSRLTFLSDSRHRIHRLIFQDTYQTREALKTQI